MACASCFAAEPPRYELVYTAEAPCPTRTAFDQLVQAQLAEFDHASTASPARVIVRFRRSASGIVGRFDLMRQDASKSSRELESPSCDEAATALAFVLALALGGREATSGTDSDAGSGPQAKSQPVHSPPSAASVAVVERRDAGDERDAESARSSWRWRFGVGVQLGARTGVGPSLTPIEAGLLAVGVHHPHPWDLSLRIAFLRGLPTSHTDQAGSSSFKWLAGRVEGCAWTASLFDRVTVTPCLLTHFGQLTVVGAPEALPGAAGRQAARLWLEMGGTVRVGLRLLQGLSLEAQADALAPLIRYRFVFDRPDTDVYRVPRLAAAAFLGLIAHFP